MIPSARDTGAAWATAIDLARWARALEKGAVVSRESYTRMTTLARQPDYVEDPVTYWRMRLLYEGRGLFIGADDAEWLQASFEEHAGRAVELAVTWPAQTPTQAIRRSPA